ncbi:YicC/YloC family endoribonuclease [Cognatazoarcus halotolerans]|uniref:YicC/YloC family endoribonuclease n=1 Tax=Cognatazoarcus halotolerans TaxID=2686016 RepID=UPI001357B981|nr:YicC/YloC family endoribonuclease [Cognatazoarcus halotolerans]MCB1898243.1 YicC family protein [Rhodocyclaceae bacterium]MCP5311674.1 YicC family protein [Zoogloeaceae bacterium]
MIHSMTGFAVQSRDLGPITLHLELRSVNSRYLDLIFRVAEDLRQIEPRLRELIGAKLNRGKVECRLNLQVNTSAPRDLSLNTGLLGQLERAQATVRTSLPEAAPLSVAEVLRWPGMLSDDSIGFDEMQPALLEIAQAAIQDMLATRRREGEKLAAVILERVARMRELVAHAAPIIPRQVSEHQEKLATRLREAMAGLDEDRIRQEVAVFAQRVDVAEELARLNTHLDEVERILSSGGASGKRLDFLMQELNREANTLGSKSFSSELTGIAMEFKLLIEQMREQVQNIE